MKKQYILFDMRAQTTGNTDNAIALDVADSIKELEENGQKGAIYSYDVEKENVLINEKFEKITN